MEDMNYPLPNAKRSQRSNSKLINMAFNDLTYRQNTVIFWRESQRQQIFVDVAIGVAGIAALAFGGVVCSRLSMLQMWTKAFQQRQTSGLDVIALNMASGAFFVSIPYVIYNQFMNLPYSRYKLMQACNNVNVGHEGWFGEMMLRYNALPVYDIIKNSVHKSVFGS